LLCFYNVILTIPVFCVFLQFQFAMCSYNSSLLCALTINFCYVFLQAIFAMCSYNSCLLCVLTILVCYVFLQFIFAICSYDFCLLCVLSIFVCYLFYSSYLQCGFKIHVFMYSYTSMYIINSRLISVLTIPIYYVFPNLKTI
jgi:hypothetical protein